MNITEISEAQFPLFFIETQNTRTDEWQRFTHEPFETLSEATEHRQRILNLNPDSDPNRVRVTWYTEEVWREDLIKAILADHDAVVRALSILRTETLCDLLR